MASRVDTVDVEPYPDTRSHVRAALELVFSLIWLYHASLVAVECCNCAAGRGRPILPSANDIAAAEAAGEVAVERPQTLGEYFAAETVDIVNLLTNGVEIVFWLVLAFGYAAPFSIPARYVVYESMDSPARPLALKNNSPQGLLQVEEAIRSVQELNRLNALYDMMHGLNLIFFAGRLLKLSDFQPRLGLVTKTIKRCGRDITHFLGVLAFLFGVACVIAHLVFGGVVTEFSTLGHTFQIVFNMLFFADGNCASYTRRALLRLAAPLRRLAAPAAGCSAPPVGELRFAPPVCPQTWTTCISSRRPSTTRE